MPIIFVPAERKHGYDQLYDSLPSVLVGRVSDAEWAQLIASLNAMLKDGRTSRLSRMAEIFLVPSILRRYRRRRMEEKIADFLAKKNLVLSKLGILIHHPKDRVYKGLDVTICALSDRSESPFF